VPSAPPPRPITFGPFGGLVLDVPPDGVGAENAIDLLDVDWDARGVLGSRMGVTEFTTKRPETNYDVIFGDRLANATLAQTFTLFARRGTTLVRLDEAGEETADTLEVSAGRINFTQIGGGEILSPITYIANQGKPVKKWDGAAFSAPTATVDGVAGKAMPEAHFIATWQDGANRLVLGNTTLLGGPAGAGGSPSHVFFSEPGQPEKFESTAFVELNPGDGEQICGIVEWGREIFVFKETHLFVFYGIGQDEEGKPEFLFRTINLGTRCIPQLGSCSPNIVAGREGVYFIARDGVWVTSGGEPTLVTDALSLAEDRREPREELGGLALPGWAQAKGIAYLNDCLYVGIPEVAGEGEHPIKRMFKIDLRTGNVTLWKTELNALMVWELGYDVAQRLFFSGAGENKGVYRYDPDSSEDATVEMEPYYESGYDELGDPDEKTFAHTKVWGSGNVDVAFGEDYGAPVNAKTYKLGAGDAIAQKQGQGGQTASIFNFRLSGAAPWSVQRLTRYLRETRVPETQKR
jgi:hypothetical protein